MQVSPSSGKGAPCKQAHLTEKHSVCDLWLCSGGDADLPGSAPGVCARACVASNVMIQFDH